MRSSVRKSVTKRLSSNTWRNRLRDEQYLGIFYHNGERIAGAYEPLLTPSTFYKVQGILTGNEHQKGEALEYAYTGMIKCSLCGEMLSGTNNKGITYYRCAKRKLPCKNIKRAAYLPEPEFEESLAREFNKITIDEEIWGVARDYVAELNQPQKLNLKKDIRILGEKVSAEEKLLIELGRKYALGEMSKSEHDRLVEDSYQKQAGLRNTIVKCENIVHELDELMYEFLDNIKNVTKRFESSLPRNKREMVDIFCENLVWKDRIASWDWKKPYFFLTKPSESSTMLPRVDSNHEHLR